MCDLDSSSFSRATEAVWALRDASGIQAMRVQVGRGSVTVVNAIPFLPGLFDGDHGRLFVAATQLRRGDDVRFLSEDHHPSLLALLWRHGAAVVVLRWRSSRSCCGAAASGSARSRRRQTPPAAPWPSRSAARDSSPCATAAATRFTRRSSARSTKRRDAGFRATASVGQERAAAVARLTGVDRQRSRPHSNRWFAPLPRAPRHDRDARGARRRP